MEMAIDTTIYVPAPSRTSAYLDWLQMLTGAGLVLFMWCHMVLVASVNLGADAMNAVAIFFEETYMAQVGGPMIAFTFLLHFILAARKVPFRMEHQATIWKHSRVLHHTDTWLWLIQAFTAMVILIMGSIHMWTVLSTLPITMVELHVGIGFYRIAVKWGFIRRKTRKGFKKFENILTGIFILIGLITIIRFLTLPI
jgi:fumarate reductase subunit C